MTKARQARLFLATLIVALAVYNFILATVASTTTTRRQRKQGRSQPTKHDLVLHLYTQRGTAQKVHSNNNTSTTRTTTTSAAGNIHYFDSKENESNVPNVAHNSAALNVVNSEGDDVCLASSCLMQQGQRLARSYNDRPKETWCLSSQRQYTVRGTNSMTKSGRRWQGLLLVKVPKAASSTSAGLTLRMANASDCHTTAVQWQHREGVFYANRTRSRSFLMAPIRQPAARAFSSTWFFMLAPLNISDTDENVIRGLNTRRGGGKTKGKGGYQFNYLSLEPIPPHSVWSPERPTRVLNASFVHDRIRALLEGYDFFLVVERWDESVVALALLTGLQLGDVLTPSAKVSGDYRLQRFGRKKGQCHYQRKGKMSAGVKAYFQSDEWLAMNYADEVLWRAANASLDLTIERLGRQRFDVALAEYKRLQQKVEQTFGQRLGYGCTAEGQLIETTEEEEQACYDRDFGCGYQLLDDLMVKERAAKGHAEIVSGLSI